MYWYIREPPSIGSHDVLIYIYICLQMKIYIHLHIHNVCQTSENHNFILQLFRACGGTHSSDMKTSCSIKSWFSEIWHTLCFPALILFTRFHWALSLSCRSVCLLYIYIYIYIYICIYIYSVLHWRAKTWRNANHLQRILFRHVYIYITLYQVKRSEEHTPYLKFPERTSPHIHQRYIWP